MDSDKTRDEILKIAAALIPTLYEYHEYPFADLATQAVAIARAVVAECDRQCYYPNYPSDLIGCTGGWRWMIFANEVFADGRVDPKAEYYAHLHSVFGTTYRTEDGPLEFVKSIIQNVAAAHRHGRIDLEAKTLPYNLVRVVTNPAWEEDGYEEDPLPLAL